jgi:hypothetical protein
LPVQPCLRTILCWSLLRRAVSYFNLIS